MQSRVAAPDIGFGLVILAGAGFGLNPLFAKMAYAAGLGPSGALLWRFVGLMLVTLPFLPAAMRQPGHLARGLDHFTAGQRRPADAMGKGIAIDTAKAKLGVFLGIQRF